MNEITFNTLRIFGRKELILQGIESILETAAFSLANSVKPKLVDLISEDLKEENNKYQFILTVKKIEDKHE